MESKRYNEEPAKVRSLGEEVDDGLQEEDYSVKSKSTVSRQDEHQSHNKTAPEPLPTGESAVAEPEDMEEGPDVYHPGGFHPIHFGEVYGGKYEILRKLGYGLYSTVWLVKNQEDGTFKALKILSVDSYGGNRAIHEREILLHLRDADAEHLGYPHISTLVDSFEHDGPHGRHVCLVFPVMSDTLLGYRQMLPGQKIHDAIAQRVAVQLLLALDYAHTFGVIHTDIKPSNVFVQLEDESLVSASYLPATAADPAAFDPSTKPWLIKSQPIALCCPDFKLTSEVNIVLGDWGVATWSDAHLTELIQPVLLRAPEVLIGASWGPTVDLWNFGAMLLEATRGKRMFSGKTPPDGKYDVRMHLREIEDMFGHFPRSFLDAGDPEIIQDCFDEDGKVKHFSNFSRPPLEWYMDGLTNETRILFSAFLRNVMKIDPTKRKNTMQLLSRLDRHCRIS